ncbi:neuronal PAS domain-containing protein 1 isoform X2 [Manis pentadactyla]|uniref:neuronal PAS domain-containing protein 1 isoform X2 n=1 Tax=Manis pentadactyla TaxID=143292 RepID=UPI00255D0AA0|nr:neuronal PAS domain-containing protein 1 isoform X2 [Manis pentadactyla]
MAASYPSSGGGSEVKCGGGRGSSVPWDFLPGLMVKAQPGPCLQAQRKEKSRNAARSRRGKENLEFFELAKLLPLPGAISSQLDKASIVRLSVTYLRLRRFAALGAPPWGLRAAGPPAGLAPGRRGPMALISEVFEQHLGGHILQSLDGFVFALNQEGKFLYISETVSIYLGLSQVELTGSSVFDYIHPGDHSEVLEQLGLRATTPGPPTSPSVPSSSSSSSSSSSFADTSEIASPTAGPPSRVQERSFFIRMKSTLTKRGLHVKASGYKVIHVTGRLRARALGLVALAHTLPPAPLAELPLQGHMIVFRLSLGLTILACESRVGDHMDLGPSELVGRSCYQFVHGQDAARIRQSHLDRENPAPAHRHPRPTHPKALPLKPFSRADRRPSCGHLQELNPARERQPGGGGRGAAGLSDLPLEDQGPGCWVPLGPSDSLSVAVSFCASPRPTSPFLLLSPPLPLSPSPCPPVFLSLPLSFCLSLPVPGLGPVLDKGQVMTGYYRWLQRAGGFVWLQSVATVAVSGKSPGERHVLWVSHVLSQAEGGQTPLDAFQLPARVACEDVSSPEPEPPDGKTEGQGRTQRLLNLPLPEPEPLVEGKLTAPLEKDKAPGARGKPIKVEPGPGETKDPEDSGDEEPSGHPALPRPEFTSVIRAGVLKQDLVRPWGLAPPGDPPPSLFHTGFLPPVMRGLCTPGTIRYGPTELGLIYPHLQRLGPGPTLPEAFYPPLGLPYQGPTGTRVQRKGD